MADWVVDSLAAQASQAAAKGNFVEAERAYRKLAQNTHVVDFEYDEWIRGLAGVYRGMRAPREAGHCFVYLHQLDAARDLFVQAGSVLDKARTDELSKKHLDAARAYRDAGADVHAAINFEQAAEEDEAGKTWERLLAGQRLQNFGYERALVHFNLGTLAARRGGDRAAAARHRAACQRLLESVADEFELAGQRERAFDCYQILLKLGRDSGAFENLAEGYLNCIRVLKDDGLKFYVLQYYEDFVRLALEREEMHAAATLYREAAEFSARAGLIYDRHYLRRSADTWWLAADKLERGGSPPEMVENAYLASIGCLSSIGDHFRVREAYRRLGALELGDKKKARFAKIMERYASVREESIDLAAFPEYMRQPHAYADVWYVDLIEWELGGDPDAVCASLIGDLKYPDSIRRHALLTLLGSLSARRTGGGRVDAGATAVVAEGLGSLQSYVALRPLERLWQEPDPEVQRSVLRAASQLFFKRSFNIVEDGLKQPPGRVREAALEAVRKLYFPHAFNRLAKIYETPPEGEGGDAVRAAALESIGKIHTLEAGEYLIGVLRHGEPAFRERAKKSLMALDLPDIVPIIRQHYEVETGPARKHLEEILSRRGR